MSIVTLHPSIVHFPIALLLLGSVLAIVYIVWPRRITPAISVWWLLLLGWLGTVAAIGSGLLAQINLPPRAPYRETLNWHIGTGLATAIVYGALLYMWWLRRPRQDTGQSMTLLDDPAIRMWVLALLVAGIAFVVASGWNGGILVYEWGVNVGNAP